MWLIPKNLCTSCQSVLEAQDSILASDWRFRMLARSFTVNTKVSPVRSFFAAWKRTNWMPLLFGRISRASTANRGVESFKQSLEEYLASRGQAPVANVDRMIRAISGRRVEELLRKSGRLSCSLKTSLECSLFEAGPIRSWESWKRWVIRLRLTCSRRRKLALLTKGSDCSSSEWPTPVHKPDGGTCMDGGANSRAAAAARGADWATWQTPTANPATYTAGNAPGYDCLPGQAQNWMTPTAHPEAPNLGSNKGLNDMATQWTTQRGSDGEKGCSNQTFSGGGVPLASQAGQWATPQAENAEQGADLPGQREGTQNLVGQTNLWPTPHGIAGVDATGHEAGAGGEFAKMVEAWPKPTGRDYRAPNAESYADRGGGAKGEQLPNFVNQWCTPGAMGGGSTSRSGDRIDEPLLAGQAQTWATLTSGDDATRFSRPDPATSAPGRNSWPRSRCCNLLCRSWLRWPAYRRLLRDSNRVKELTRKRLNPLFVCWLQGWPLTALDICGSKGMDASLSAPALPSCTFGWLSEAIAWRQRMKAELSKLLNG